MPPICKFLHRQFIIVQFWDRPNLKKLHKSRLGPNFQNFPKIFSKDLSMSDDLGIPKKVFFFEFLTAFFAFPKNFFISYLPKLVQPIICA